MVGDEQLKESFRRVKGDISRQDEELAKLKAELSSLRNQMDSVLPSLLETNQLILKRLENIEQGLGKRKDPIKEQLLNKYSRKRKDVVMAKILELSAQKEYKLSELRTVIVEDLGYSSRASFYRYIELLKKLGRLDSISINGIETVKILY